MKIRRGFHLVVLVAVLFSLFAKPGMVVPVKADTAVTALQFNGSSQYVTFGQATAELGVTTFTLEAWVKRAPGGKTMGTGTLGLGDNNPPQPLPSAYPVITKGRGQGETPANVNMNYWLGIASTGVIAADFEDNAGGVNHPILGTTTVPIGEWHHISVTYTGSCWNVLLDGRQDTINSLTTQCPNKTPESTSAQHAALATALQTSGSLPTDSGFFSGIIDEARIWNYARSQAQIQAGMPQEITSESGLIGRWGLNEGSGTTANNSVSGLPNGTLSCSGTGCSIPVWVTGFPLPDTTPPAAPSGLSTVPFTGGVSLSWNANLELDLAGYNLYRSATSGGTYTKVNASVISTNSYTDGGLTNGTNYYYVLKAVDTSNNESAASLEVIGTPDANYGAALKFDGVNDYVTFGPNLNASAFTLEAWVKRDSGGATMSTGTNGMDGTNGRPLAYPVLTKGMGEGESPANVNMNWFLGITNSGVIGADFEDNAGGVNHPAWGSTVLPLGEWHHIAAVYTGSCWSLYLDGNLETLNAAATACPGATPEYNSIQHAGLGAGLGSTGQLAAGYFAGAIDEARVWNVARSQVQIQSTMNNEVVNGTGLIGRWGMNEGAGVTIADSTPPVVNGAINGPIWAPGKSLAVPDTTPPTAPTGLFATAGVDSVSLAWTANTEVDLAGYNVYRSTSVPVTKTTPINGSLLTSATYTDSTAVHGSTYYYAVTAVDISGNESTLSLEANATPTAPVEPANGLDFGSGTAYVTFGDPAKLDLATFTIETWFKRTGAGTSNTTGNGGITAAIPLVTHGAPEADGSNVDANWILAIDNATGKIAADFEDMATGLNHPVIGTTVITNDVWHHAAATYDGTTWRLYLDGNLENTLVVNQTPRSDSTQKAGLGTMLTSGGIPLGHFQGVLDETRIWNVAHSKAEIQADINNQVINGNGLVARWGYGEISGMTVPDSVSVPADGTITGTGSSWVPGAPFNIIITPPTEYTLVVNTSGNGHVTVSPMNETYPAGTVVQLTAIPDTGWTFNSWSGDISGANNPITITMDGNKTLTATFSTGYEATATFQQGVNGYTGTVDSLLYEGVPGTSYGSYDYIKWDTSGAVGTNPSAQMFGLLRFDNIFGSGPGQVLAGSHIVSAQLDYVVFDTGNPANMNEVAVEWDESTTYSGFGGDAGVQADEYGNLVASAPGTATGIYSLNVTASLNSWSATPENNKGWIFIPTGSDGVQVRSKEAGTLSERPRLIVTYLTNVPPNQAPAQPVNVAPENGTTGISTTPTLEVQVRDPDADPMSVSFYGRPTASAAGPDFTIVALPDTQNYTVNTGGDVLFSGQAQWVVNQQAARNIVYVAHLGDITQDGSSDTDNSEWIIADNAMKILDRTSSPADDIPYGVTPGNHDLTGGDAKFEQWFGVSRFTGRSYYGGYYGGNNRNSYELFSASGMDFIVINIDSTVTPTTAVLDWADALLKSNPARRGIITCHYLTNPGTQASFLANAQTMYDALKDNPNLFLMLGGHSPGVGQRTDTYNGNTVYSLMSDYQNETNGGDGWLRVMTFSPTNSQIHVKTYSPALNQYKTDSSNQFVLDYPMSGSTFQLIGTVNNIVSGGTATVTWPGLDSGAQYEWYAVANDGAHSTNSDTWTFTTTDGSGTNHAPVLDPIGGKSVDEGTALTFTATATDPDNNPLTYSLGSGVPSGASIDTSSGVFTWIPTEAQGFGSYPVTVRVSDGNLLDTETITITVNEVNQNPVITNPMNQAHAEGNIVSLQIGANDADLPANTLIYSASTLPAGLTINSTTGLISGTVDYSASASSPYTVTVTVSDGAGGSAQVSFTWTITDSAPPPNGLTCSTITPKPTTITTGEKPQSKVWNYNGAWYAVFPTTDSGASSAGSWLWKLNGTTWTEVLKLSDATNTKADVKVSGNLAHILLYNDPATTLASVEYTGGTYQLWSGRSTLTSINLPGSEIATIDIDSTGRMWLATRQDSPSPAKIVVYYSDSPFTSFQGPVTLESGVVSGDDISVITTLTGGKIGVLWSNQNTKRFGFRVHVDGTDPSIWSADELPASRSANDAVGTGMADDHLNVKVASDGTLYAAVKTGWDTTGYPKMAFLVRHPNGIWDDLRGIDEAGTRPNIELDEVHGVLNYIYTQSEGNNPIVYRQSNLNPISFGAKKTLRAESFNDVSSTKQSYNGELVVIYGNGTQVGGQNCTTTPASGVDLAIAIDDGRASARPNDQIIYTITVTNNGPDAVTGATVTDTLPDSLISATWTCAAPTGGSCGSASGSGNLSNTVSLPAGGTATHVVTVTLDLGARGSLVNTANVTNPSGVNDPITSNNTATDTDTIVTGGTSCEADPSLVGCWQMEEGSGTVLMDGSTFANDAALYNSPIWVTGNVGSHAIGLNGTNQYGLVRDNASLDLTNQFTLAAWIRPEQYGTQSIITKATNGGTNGYELSLATTKTDASSQRAFFRINQVSNGDNYRINATTMYPINGDWMHVAASYDGITMRLYINGVLENSLTPPVPPSISNNPLPLGIGAQIDVNNIATRWFKGSIDEARVYNHALSAAEIQILAGNHPPAAVADTYTTNEDTPLNISAPGVLSNDTDPDGNALTAVKASDPVNGTLRLNADGSFAYTPNANFNGADSFTYKASDGMVESTVATVNFTVSPVNDAPVCQNVSLITNEDTPGQVSPSCTDVESDPLTYTIAAQPAHGTASVENSKLSYTPAANYSGNDSFSYTANDGRADSNIATVDVTVSPVNDAPILALIADQQVEELSLFRFTAAATEVEDDPLTFSLMNGPAGANITSAGYFTWTPSESQGPGTYTFDVCVNDGTASDCQTVHITVAEINAAPVLNPIGDQTVAEGSLLTFTSTASDADLPANTLTFNLGGTPPAGASVGASTGVFTWTPIESQGPGEYSFDISVSDGSKADSETIVVTVSEINTPPVAVPQTLNTPEDTSLAITLSASDADLPANQLTYHVTSPAHGTLTGTAPDLTYTPAANYYGTDSLTFTVNDGQVDSNQATVTITIQPVNDAPVFIKGADQSIPEDSPAQTVPGWASGITPGPLNESSQAVNFIVTNDQHGLFSVQPAVDATGVLSYTPAPGAHGQAVVSIRIHDDGGIENGGVDTSEPQTFTITITSVNHAPVANDQPVSTAEDTSIAVTLSGLDIDGDPLTFSIAGSPSHGTLSGTAPDVTYTPAANYYGADSFTFSVNDGTVDSVPATVSITVTPVNDAPVAVDDSYSTLQDTTQSIAAPGVLGNDTDIDSSVFTAVLVNGPAHGILSLNSDGSFTYTPNASYSNADSFTYKVNDGTAESNVATVTITVSHVNHAPVAQDQSVTTLQDKPAAITLVATDADNDTLTYGIDAGPSHGTLSGAGPNQTYTPNAGYYGSDNFTFKANDGAADSNIATVTITVNQVHVNHGPAAANDSYSTEEGTALTVPAPGILSNDSDPDGDALTAVQVSEPGHGTLTLNQDGSFTYISATGWSGTDSFTYKASDGSLASDTASVTVTVSPKRLITFRSASSAANKVASSLTIATPSGIQPGDILIAAISVQAAPAITAPNGWIKIRNDATANNTLRQALYYKIAVSGEPPSFSWSFSSAQAASGGIVAYIGVDNTNPIGASGGQVNPSSTSYTAPSVTISNNVELLVGFFGIASNAVVTPPSNMQEHVEIAASSGKNKVTTEISDEYLTSSGDSGTRTATGDKAVVSIGQLVALLPANAGPAPDQTAPTVPQGLVATAVSAEQVDLTWTSSTDNVAVTGYTVYRDGTVIGTTTVARYSDTTVSPGQSYTYQVDAYDAAGNHSTLSNEASAETPPLSQGIQFVGAASGSTQSASRTLIINRPSGAVSGHLLLASIDLRDGATITPPLGWTQLIETHNGTSLTKVTYYRVAGAGEPASYVWTFSVPEGASGIILAYSGVDPNSPIAAYAGQTNQNGTALTAPSVNASTSGSVLVAFYGLATAASITPPTSMMERAEIIGTSGKIKVTSEVADQWLIATGDTGTRTATANKAELSIGQSIILKAAGSSSTTK